MRTGRERLREVHPGHPSFALGNLHASFVTCADPNVATIPLVAAYSILAIFYRTAVDSAGRQPQNPNIFRSRHSLEDH
jgi:hypothetical protein